MDPLCAMGMVSAVCEMISLIPSVLKSVEHSKTVTDELVAFLSDTGCGRSSLVRKVRMLISLSKRPAANFELRLAILKFTPLQTAGRNPLSVLPFLNACLLDHSGDRPPYIFLR